MRESKTLLVTGASSDVGIALIDAVADNYSLIVAHSPVMTEKFEALLQRHGGKIKLVSADFSDAESVKAMAEELKNSDFTIDHIVHLTAPKAANMQFRKEKMDMLDLHLNVSLKSIFILLQALLPKMVKQKYGKVVLMLTSYVVGVPPKFQTSYITSKHALLGLMKSLSVEYMGYGVTVNGVSPDMIETKYLEDLPHFVVEQNSKDSLMGRNLKVNDVVPAFKYLLSDGADTVTGLNLEIRNRA